MIKELIEQIANESNIKDARYRDMLTQKWDELCIYEICQDALDDLIVFMKKDKTLKNYVRYINSSYKKYMGWIRSGHDIKVHAAPPLNINGKIVQCPYTEVILFKDGNTELVESLHENGVLFDIVYHVEQYLAQRLLTETYIASSMDESVVKVYVIMNQVILDGQ